MCQTPSVGGERIDQLTKYCYSEIIVSNSLPAWLPFDQLFCKFESIGASRPPRPQTAHPWLKPEKFAKNTFTKVDKAD